MVRTFVDSSVLIAASRGGEAALAAMSVLDDPNRTFLTSEFVKLETLPKPSFHGYPDQVAWLQTFFSCAESAQITDKLVEDALTQAIKHGLTALDAMHVAAAKAAQADELVTGELPTKPMFRVQGLRVVSIRK